MARSIQLNSETTIPVPARSIETSARGERLELTVPTAAGLLYVTLSVSALGYVAWTRAVGALGPERAGTYLHLIPVFGTVMATIFLGERLAPYHLVGAVLVAGGLWLAGQRRTPAVPVARAPARQQAPQRE